MPRPPVVTLERLAPLLMARGPVSAAELAAALKVNRATIVRALAGFGERLVALGATRRARYALRRSVGTVGSRWPLYRIDESGRARLWAFVEALHERRWRVVWAETPPEWAALFSDREGLWDGYPFFLNEIRPQGFLGRGIARAVSRLHPVPEDPRVWSDDHTMIYLLTAGEDVSGSLVAGDASLRRALEFSLYPPAHSVTASRDREEFYPQAALHAADSVAGSSAGGEQPKFLVTLEDDADGTPARRRPVLVKFSPPMDQPASRRWADLLLCEFHAHRVLAEQGLAMPGAEILDAAGRRFLEVPRFDRTGAGGRRGVVSLSALHDAAVGSAERRWPLAALDLLRLGLIDGACVDTVRRLHAFGELIGNTDMHTANLSFWLTDTLPLRPAPAYDMLPMLWAPGPQGEILSRPFVPAPPLPEDLPHWREAAGWAEEFWRRVAEDARLSADFRETALAALEAARRLREHTGGW